MCGTTILCPECGKQHEEGKCELRAAVERESKVDPHEQPDSQSVARPASFGGVKMPSRQTGPTLQGKVG